MTRLWIAAVAAGLLLVAGCREEDRGPAETSGGAASRPAPAAPPIPGMDPDAGATDGRLVAPGPPREHKPRYTYNESADSGALRVICRIPSVQAPLPAPKAIDFQGDWAIRDPATVEPYTVIHDGINQRGYRIANELDFYKNWNPPMVPAGANWLCYPRGARTGNEAFVNGAAVIVEGIMSGRREELGRGGVLVSHRERRQGYFQGTGNHSACNIAFLPPNEKVVFRSGDHFPCEVAISAWPGGEPLGEPFHVPALPFKREGMYAGWLLRANPGSATQPRPKPAPSPTFRKKGIYFMRCLRHPWHTGYAIVVDNPYVAVPSRDGRLTINGIPPGKWTVRIWHPLIRPVKETHEVTIERDETTHLIVDFKSPPGLPTAKGS